MKQKNNIWCHNNLQIIINYSFSLNILEPFRTLLFINLCVVLDEKQVCKKTVFKKTHKIQKWIVNRFFFFFLLYPNVCCSMVFYVM